MPADQFPKDDPFHALEGRDGFHVVKVELGPVLTLTVMTYYGGVLCNVNSDPENASVEILDLYDPTPAQRGGAERLRLVMDAVCRYFTTGGTWAELSQALATARKVVQGGVAFPGYHLVTSYSTTDGDYQHVFAADDGSGRAVLWNEPEVGDAGTPVGGWIESTTLEKIREEQENDDEGGPRRPRRVDAEEGGGGGEAEEAGPAGARPVLSLPGRQGVRPAEADPGRGGAGVPEPGADGGDVPAPG